MCKKLFYLVSVFVLSLACTSYADVVFQDGTIVRYWRSVILESRQVPAASL